ncbi:MAG: response regulator, partial [Bdellovibrionales bacterium]|nr:response regulator [Bdellovibrionales bacterium]
EDEPDIAQSYVDILKNDTPTIRPQSRFQTEKKESPGSLNNFDLTIVNSAEDALKKVQEMKSKGESFAMGFFDVRLSHGMDGIELVKHIFSMDPNFYAVFVTAYQDRSIESINDYLGEEKSDHWDYLNKPFSRGEILQKARSFVSLWNLKREKQFQEKALSELNAKLNESEKLNSIAAVARSAGHEFGNILLQIIGKAELSLSKPPEKMREALQKILDASLKASEILDRFKTLTDNSAFQQTKEKVDLKGLIQDTIDLMEQQLEFSKIDVEVKGPDQLELEINETSIMQVLINLTMNSIHSMKIKAGGKIEYSLEDEGDEVVIRIRDFGPGIDEKIMDKVVEPLFTTKGKEGTGLGLSICKEIVEAEHGGSFTLQNHSEQGLEVIIRLPKKTEIQRAA